MYELAFHPDVTKSLKDLDRSVRQRILDKIQWLLEHVACLTVYPPGATG